MPCLFCWHDKGNAARQLHRWANCNFFHSHHVLMPRPTYSSQAPMSIPDLCKPVLKQKLECQDDKTWNFERDRPQLFTVGMQWNSFEMSLLGLQKCRLLWLFRCRARIREQVSRTGDARACRAVSQRVLAASAFGSARSERSAGASSVPPSPPAPYRNASMTLETHAHSERPMWTQSIGKKVYRLQIINLPTHG